MTDKVKKVLQNNLWYLATYDDEPNAIPVAFKDVSEDGKLLVGDVFLETTLNNIRANGKIAVSVCDGTTMEGYQLKGTAKYVTEGSTVEAFAKAVETMF